MLLQKQSPTKNSDYIRRSILLSHRSAGTAGNKTKRGEELDCPSVYDDKEFDEECAQIGNEEHLPATSNDTRGKLPLNGPHSNKQKDKPLTRRDPLKNSLFHNFKVQTQRLHNPSRTAGHGGPTGWPQQHSNATAYQTNADLGGHPGALKGIKSQKELVYNTNRAGDSKTNQSSSWYTNARGQTSTHLAVQSSNDFMFHNTSTVMQPKQAKSSLSKNKSASQLQQHLSQTAQLQRGRVHSKKHAHDGTFLNQSNHAFGHPVGSVIYNNFTHQNNTSAFTSLGHPPNLPGASPLSVSNASLQQPSFQQLHLDTLLKPTQVHQDNLMLPQHRQLYFNESEPSHSDSKPKAMRSPKMASPDPLAQRGDQHLGREAAGDDGQGNATTGRGAATEGALLRTKSNSVFAHGVVRHGALQPSQG